MTHYQVLGVTPDAPLELIEFSWKNLMRCYHPDGPSPDAEKAVRINQAHDVLSNPESRKKYDAELAAKKPKPIRNVEPAYPPAYPNPFSDFELDFGAIGESFFRAGAEAAVNHLMDSNPVLKAAMKAASKKKAG